MFKLILNFTCLIIFCFINIFRFRINKFFNIIFNNSSIFFTANYLTNVEIKTGFLGFGFKGFNSISGFKCKDEIEQVSMIYAFNKLT